MNAARRVWRLSTVLAGILLLAAPAMPASAGTGASNWCDDGLGGDIPILTSPITVGVEIDGPGEPAQRVIVCCSTSAAGEPSMLTGGAIRIDIITGTGTAYPGASVSVICTPDISTGLAPACNLPGSADIAPGDITVSAPPSSICLVSVGAGCVAYLPGVKLATGGDGRPTAVLRILGVTAPVDLPPQCIAVIVTC